MNIDENSNHNLRDKTPFFGSSNRIKGLQNPFAKKIENSDDRGNRMKLYIILIMKIIICNLNVKWRKNF